MSESQELPMRGAPLSEEVVHRLPMEDEEEVGEEKGDVAVDMIEWRKLRGASLLEELSLQMAAEEVGTIEKEASGDPSAEGSEEDGQSDRRRAAVFDAKQLEEMLQCEEKSTQRMDRHRRKVGKMWQELDALIDSRATKVSRDLVEESDVVLWAGTWNVANKTPVGNLAPWLSRFPPLLHG